MRMAGDSRESHTPGVRAQLSYAIVDAFQRPLDYKALLEGAGA
jgi:hypothetical protein